MLFLHVKKSLLKIKSWEKIKKKFINCFSHQNLLRKKNQFTKYPQILTQKNRSAPQESEFYPKSNITTNTLQISTNKVSSESPHNPEKCFLISNN